MWVSFAQNIHEFSCHPQLIDLLSHQQSFHQITAYISKQTKQSDGHTNTAALEARVVW